MLRRNWFAAAAAVALGVALLAAIPTAAKPRHHRGERKVRHIILLSVDGLHQSDLAWYVQHHPDSALAYLVAHGAQFTGAQTPVPSDSFPGMVGQVTGGDPWTTGIYYDDTWNHALLPAGTTDCSTAKPGVEVTYFEALDKDPTALDAGQGLENLPFSILNMTGKPQRLIDPKLLPVDPKTCRPVYPHQYLRVNTLFEVVHKAGLRTAWSDKHPAYEILDGPSGKGIDDLFTPEINSNASAAGNDWTTDNGATQVYDSFKVKAVLNEIKGLDHSGHRYVGMPAVFGMNFQTVSTAEKLPTGGYQTGGTAPTGLLAGALDYIDRQVAAMLDELRHTGHLKDTAIILSAKHGQSPQDPAKLTRIKDSKIIDDLNTAWAATPGHAGQTLVAFSVNDDGMLIWLGDRSQAAADFAKSFLLAYNGKGDGSDGKATSTGIDGNPKAYTQAGLAQVYAGSDAAGYFHIPAGDQVGLSRVPDVLGVAQVGTVYTGGTKKIAEHGGANPQDRDVPLLVSGSMIKPAVQGGAVETTSIAPTILSLLGFDPGSLQAVRIEHTPTLPVVLR